MRARVRLVLAATLVLLLSPAPFLRAHIGSPDVFVETKAGPYTLFVTVRPPRVIPGIAEVEIQTSGPEVRDVRIVPTPLTGAAAKFAPTPDRTTRSSAQPPTFSGHLWMMTAGAWQVRLNVEGAAGSGVASVPVPTLPQATSEMTSGLGALLFALMLLLATGLISVVAAMAREATLGAGESADRRARRRGRIAAAIATVVVTLVLWLGKWWWNAEASAYARYVYKPLEAAATVTGNRLSLLVRDPGWISLRRTDDFVADHGHLMHLFVVSPGLDRFWHLHPALTGPASFEARLPAMPGGPYEFFADVVHASGIPETVAGRLDLVRGEVVGEPLKGDDSTWQGAPLAEAIAANTQESSLSDGSRMVWIRESRQLRPRQLTAFTFRVQDAAGQPVTDLEPYMGMLGHAVFVGRDRQVFAHVHPSGSAPMAAMEISARSIDGTRPVPSGEDHAAHAIGLPATVSFPFGLPAAGDYRIFVQVKKAGQVLTGVFDAHVE